MSDLKPTPGPFEFFAQEAQQFLKKAAGGSPMTNSFPPADTNAMEDAFAASLGRLIAAQNEMTTACMNLERVRDEVRPGKLREHHENMIARLERTVVECNAAVATECAWLKTAYREQITRDLFSELNDLKQAYYSLKRQVHVLPENLCKK